MFACVWVSEGRAVVDSQFLLANSSSDDMKTSSQHRHVVWQLSNNKSMSSSFLLLICHRLWTIWIYHGLSAVFLLPQFGPFCSLIHLSLKGLRESDKLTGLPTHKVYTNAFWLLELWSFSIYLLQKCKGLVRGETSPALKQRAVWPWQQCHLLLSSAQSILAACRGAAERITLHIYCTRPSRPGTRTHGVNLRDTCRLCGGHALWQDSCLRGDRRQSGQKESPRCTDVMSESEMCARRSPTRHVRENALETEKWVKKLLLRRSPAAPRSEQQANRKVWSPPESEQKED